ncbi:MAG TPA: sugar transferase [Bryobacteraceae bacterium]|nr:sugar transferase [Bryobacteraceae bacterium]
MTAADSGKKSPEGASLPFWIAGFDFLACLAGFSAAIWVYASFAAGTALWTWPAEWTREALVSALTTWIAVAFTGNPWGDGVRLWIDRLFSAIGFNLMVQYGLDYLFHILPTPWPIALLGSVLSIALIGSLPKRRDHALAGVSGGTLILGYDSLAESIRPMLGGNLVGVLGDSVPHSVRSLGDLSRFESVLASEKPRRVIVNDPAWSRSISPRRLLALRYAGVAFEDGPFLYENLFQRVSWERIDNLDLLLSPRLNINRPAIALQAIYTNVFGLTLLLVFSPVLIVAAVVTVLSTGESPLETVECLGFQRIPFQRLRFRTHRRNQTISWSGKLLKSLNLVDLPELINVIRGEMGLFGPPPVRKEFAECLVRLIPVYAYRFSVKPGILGWSQANLSGVSIPDESLRFAYDLYYMREESPSLDLDILFRTLFRAPVDGEIRPE